MGLRQSRGTEDREEERMPLTAEEQTRLEDDSERRKELALVQANLVAARATADEAEKRTKGAAARAQRAEEAQTKLEGRLRDSDADRQKISHDYQLLQTRMQKEEQRFNGDRRTFEEVRAKLSADLERKESERLGARHEAESLRQELDAVRALMREQQTLLDTRTVELRETQAFLSTADTYSHADILQMVEHLNDEIFQLAALISENCLFEGQTHKEQVVAESVQRVQTYVGEGLVEFVARAGAAKDSGCVQMVLQSAMAHFLARIASSWDGMPDHSKDAALTGIYASMLRTEPIAVCGKWRALTAQHAAPGGRGVHYDVHLDDFAHLLIGILIIAGASGDPEELFRTNVDTFGGRLTELVGLAEKLRKATKEEVLSADFQLLLPRYGEVFEHQTMDDIEAKSSKATRKKEEKQGFVLCATDLGLVRDERRADSPGFSPETVTMVMLKAKVALALIADGLGQ